MRNTLIVNLFTFQNVDVEIVSCYILAQMKILGISSERVVLCTKRLVDTDKIYDNPLYLIGKQSFEITKLFGEVDVIVNEYPLLNFIKYIDDINGGNGLKHVSVEEFMKYGGNNLNIYLNSIDEDTKNKNEVWNMLNELIGNICGERVDYIDVDASMRGCSMIVQLITGVLKNMHMHVKNDG